MVRFVSETFGNQRDLKIVRSIFHVLRGWPVCAFNGDVAQLFPVCQPATSFLRGIGRSCLSIFQHPFISFLPINSLQMFCVSIANQEFCIASTLRPSREIAAPGV